MKPYILINFDGAPVRRGLGGDFTFVDFPPQGPLPDKDVRASARIIVTGQAGLSREQDEVLIGRQALHAFRLRFRHPRTNEWIEAEAPLPPDMRRALEAIRTHRPLRG